MKQKSPLKSLFEFAGPYKLFLIASIICALISGLCIVVPYIGVYRLMSAILNETMTKEFVVENALMIIGFTILRFIFFSLSGALSHKGAYGALFSLRLNVMEHMGKIPLGKLDERNIGEMKTLLNDDIEKLEQFLAHNLPDLVQYFVGPVAIFIYLLSVNTYLAIASALPLLLMIFIMSAIYKRSAGMIGQYSKNIVQLNSAILEYVRGMKLIKAYNMGSFSFKKFSCAVEEENATWNTMTKKLGPLYAAYVVVIECGLIIVIPLGSLLFLQGSITASVFMLFAYIGSVYLTELKPLQDLGNDFANVFHAVTKAEEILAIPLYDGKENFPDCHDIELKGVTFAYNEEKDVLKNCDLKIAQGEKIAIIGASGAGKSTILGLVSRFYDTVKGEVLIGGINVKNISYDKLLENISMVFQKTFLTEGSVFENICMGSNSTLCEVREASKKAQIDDFIMSLPQGYDTNVGDFGARFSGGEKQRIAIARAILKDAPILILDEATSAADPENQLEIDKALNNLCEGKTVIIVAHRLGIISICDKIAVVENHRVTSCSNHDELMLENTYYKKTWQDYKKARAISY